MDYTNLIDKVNIPELAKALRYHTNPDVEDYYECPYRFFRWSGECTDRIIADAADAIEALQAQLPKQGEWKRDEKRWGDNLIRCSLCGAVIEDDEWGWRNYYCYHCGAKMKVWDGESNN